MKKYEFTGEEKECYGFTLKQIRRISDGEIGGWIEKAAYGWADAMMEAKKND
jgi:hypothetical protein